jgi:hypothetical protein
MNDDTQEAFNTNKHYINNFDHTYALAKHYISPVFPQYTMRLLQSLIFSESRTPKDTLGPRRSDLDLRASSLSARL